MKSRVSLVVFWLVVAVLVLFGGQALYSQMPPELLDYEVMSINSNGWVITAKELATGEVVKFKLPPAVLKGQTFNFDVRKANLGKPLTIRGHRNAQLNRMKIQKGLPMTRKSARMMKTPLKPKPILAGRPLPWSVLLIDAKNWVVTAKNSRTNKVAKFKVHPQAFKGFRFRANLRGIRQGQGFKMIAPNSLPMKNICTLLEMK